MGERSNNHHPVFVVDSDPKHRKAVSKVLASAGLTVQSFPSKDEFDEAFDATHPSCLVTDLQTLPFVDGFERTLSEEAKSHPVVVVSGHMVPAVRRALHEGKFTWLRRPYENGRLLDAVGRALLRDEHEHEDRTRQRDIESRIRSLTSGERQVLGLMFIGKPNKAIAKQLKVAMRTVERRRRRIYKKLDAHSLAEVVLMVAEAKYGGMSE